MRILKIEIERFKGIKHLKIRLPSAIQLVAGANNSGKSTLIKALDLFFSGVGETVPEQSFKPKNRYYEHESSRALTKIKIHFDDFSAHELEEFDEAIGDRSQSLWCQLKISRLGKVSFEGSQGFDGRALYDLLLSRYSVFHIPVLRVSSDGFSDIETERYMRAVSNVLIRNRPGPRSSVQNKHDSNTQRFSKLVGQVLSDSKSKAESLLPAGSDISFGFPGAKDILNAVLANVWIKSRPSDGLALSEEGTGYQSLLSLGLLSHVVAQEGERRNQNVLILLEEPEAFLHPQYQRRVVSFIRDIIMHAQVIMSTHSTVIVDAIDVQNIMRIERNTKGLVANWDPTALTEKEIGKLSRWCDAKNSELIFADKVIFCEGVSDANAIRKIFDLSPDFKDLTSNISIIPMDSRDNADKFVEMIRRFNIPSMFVFDKDVHTGDRATLKKVANSLEKPISQTEYAALDTSKGVHCNSIEDSNRERNKVNEILQKRRIFALGSDIEGALSTSYSRIRTTACLSELGLLSSEVRTELAALAGNAYFERLFTVMGSKGWATRKAGEKLKPHHCGEIIDKLGLNFDGNSDLAALKKVMKEFLAE